MIIDRLVLENFKRFKNQEIRFQDGITGILGNNGTGKSSIVQAIFFALYGVQGTGILPDHIVSSFASPRERCAVRLDFRIGGESYTILRTFKKGKTIQHDATLHKGSEKRATGVNTVENEVRRILGMGPVDFKNTIYAAQKDLLILLENTPGRRKEWFLRALGIDYLNTESQKILKERVDAHERELQLAEGELKGLMERRNPQELSVLQATVLSYHDTIEDLTKIHEGQIIKKDQIDAELRQFSDRKTEHARIVERHHSLVKETEGLIHQKDLVGSQVADVALLEQEYQELEKMLSAFPDKKKRLDSLRILKTDFDHLMAERRFAERYIADLDRRLEKTRTKIADLDRDAATMQALCVTIRKNTSVGDEISDDMLEQAIISRHADILHTIRMLSTQQNTLVEEWKSLLSNWETIKNAGPDGICPLCHQTLGSHYARIEQEFTARIETLQNQALRVCEEQERITNEKERIDRELPDVDGLRRLLEKQKTRDAIESELQELISLRDGRERERRALEERNQELGFDTEAFEYAVKEVAGLERIQGRFIDLGKKVGQGAVWRRQLSDLGEQINRKQADLAELSALITRSSFDPEAGARLDHGFAEINSAIRTTETGMARTTERLLNAEEKIDAHKKAEEQIILLQQRINVLKEDTNLLRLTRSVIADYVVYLLQVVRSRIESEVSRIISEITGGRYEQVLLDEDFNLLVRDLDNDYPIDRFSGGEQDDIAVALRIALSRYLAELHQMHESTLLIFDEIFGSQDEERRTSLLTALRTQESRFPQILLISHISEIQGEFTSTLIVEMGTDLASRVREVV